jgi:uncharacterized membrane protein
MTEFTQGIQNAIRNVYDNNRGTILRTIIYTIGHFTIAIICLMLIADVPFSVAMTDAIIEPLVNGVWYFVLDKFWASKMTKSGVQG